MHSVILSLSRAITTLQPGVRQNIDTVRTITNCQDNVLYLSGQKLKKMGRKSKLEIRVTSEEYEAVNAAAEGNGTTISDYCRGLLGLSLSGQKGLVSVRTEPVMTKGDSKPVRTEKQSPSGQDVVRTEDMPAWKVKLLQQQEEKKRKEAEERKKTPSN